MVKYFVPLGILLSFVLIFLFSSITYTILALISALFMWLISSIAKRKGSYKEFLITSLYAITLVVVLNLILSVFGQMSFPISLLITLFVWGINVEIWKKVVLPSNDVMSPPMTEPTNKV